MLCWVPGKRGAAAEAPATAAERRLISMLARGAHRIDVPWVGKRTAHQINAPWVEKRICSPPKLCAGGCTAAPDAAAERRLVTRAGQARRAPRSALTGPYSNVLDAGGAAPRTAAAERQLIPPAGQDWGGRAKGIQDIILCAQADAQRPPPLQLSDGWFPVLARGAQQAGRPSESASPERRESVRHVTFSSVPESPRPRNSRAACSSLDLDWIRALDSKPNASSHARHLQPATYLRIQDLGSGIRARPAPSGACQGPPGRMRPAQASRAAPCH